MSKNLLSFIRDDTRKPQIDRTRHIHQQLAISPDSPSQFHIRNANIQNILFSKVEDPNLRRRLEVKRIISQGKSLNMENHQVNKSANLTNVDDSMQSEPDRYKKKYRIYDTITSEFKEYTRDLDISQRSLLTVFIEEGMSQNIFVTTGPESRILLQQICANMPKHLIQVLIRFDTKMNSVERSSIHRYSIKSENLKSDYIIQMDAETKKVFEIKKWNAVALWSWDIKVDNCAICKNHIMEKCIDCDTQENTAECIVAWGSCNHAYHFHCIERWLKNRQTCPLDNRPWEYQKMGC